MPSRTAITTDDGQERGDGAVDADERRQHGDEQHHQHDAAASGCRPRRAISCWPAQAVTPVASSASLTTKSDAMKITVGSPKPPSACSRSRTPVAQSDSATPIATTADRQPVPDEHGDRRAEDRGT